MHDLQPLQPDQIVDERQLAKLVRSLRLKTATMERQLRNGGDRAMVLDLLTASYEAIAEFSSRLQRESGDSE